jgi:hypothetical protein
VFSYILLLLLVALLLAATPRFRSLNHNAFERIHRFAGWLSTAMFWVATLIFVHDSAKSQNRTFGEVLVHTPTFWILIIITCHLILPWLRLRKMTFTSHILSERSMRLDFQENNPPISGVALAISPLMEWHPFATFPNPKAGMDCHSIIISFTGDWTRRNIDNPRPQYWVKGIPKIGLLSLAFLFRSVLVVTTGSGIGPCLSLLLTSAPARKRTTLRMIWSTPSPILTYGSDLCDSILDADPQAIIIDTKVSGRPDLVSISYAAWRDSDVEAVFVISNRKVTRMLVDSLNTKGVPAFGPIWDS